MKNKEAHIALGKRIQELRQQQNITTKDLAQAIGKDEAQIIKLEAGNGNPWMSELFLIINKLDIPVSEFFARLS